MYKIVHNLVEIHAEHLLIPADSRTRWIAAFRAIYTRADVYRFSFFPRTIIIWNSIPPDVRQTSTIGQFQAGLGSISSSDSHFKLEIIDVTAPGSRSWKLFETNRAALRCTESSWDIWFLLNGSHTELAYSMETRCILLFKYCSWYLSLLKVVTHSTKTRYPN
jgi:hypothetical protein